MIRFALFMQKESEIHYFRKLIAGRPDFALAGAGNSGISAIQDIYRRRPDIVLLDENLAGMMQGSLVAAILTKFRRVKVIVAAANAEKPGAAVLQAIRAGAAGYCEKNIGAERFFRGMLTVMQGGCMMSPQAAAAAFRSSSLKAPRHGLPAGISAARLSRRDLKMVLCLGQGKSCREIAEIVGLSYGTVRNRLSALYGKMGLRNRGGMALYLHRAGLLDTDIS